MYEERDKTKAEAKDEGKVIVTTVADEKCEAYVVHATLQNQLLDIQGQRNNI